MADSVWLSSTSGPRLAGLIDQPEGPVRGWGVFSHGFTLGKNSLAASRICKQLANEGVGMLRFDNLGLGDLDGDWGDGSFSHKVADTAQAVRFMNESGRVVRLLVGHSFGGAAVIAVAHQLDSVRAVASIGAPDDWRTTGRVPPMPSRVNAAASSTPRPSRRASGSAPGLRTMSMSWC